MQKLSITLLVAAAASLLLSLSAAAEDANKASALNLNQVMDIALKNQIDIVTAQNNITIAKSRLAQNTSGYLPQISLQNNAFVVGSSGVLSQSTTGTAFTASQNIFDGGLREANVQGARYGVKQNSAAFDRTRQTVIYNVTHAYYEVLRAKHLAQVSEANVKYNECLRDQIQSQAEQGEAAQVDVLPVEAQLANARVNLLSAKNAVRTSAIDLQSEMGVISTPGFDVADVEMPTNAAIEPMETYMASALKARSDIFETQAGLGVARSSVKAARVSLYPRPVISGNYQKSVSGGFQQSGSQITGGIAFDLFNGGANRAAYKEAKATQANAVQQAQQLDRNVRAQVEEAYLNLTNSKERLAASELSLQAAQKNLEAQKERYSKGLAITLDLLNAEVQTVTAQSNDVQARYDYYNAIAQMEYAVGKQGGSNVR